MIISIGVAEIALLGIASQSNFGKNATELTAKFYTPSPLKNKKSASVRTGLTATFKLSYTQNSKTQQQPIVFDINSCSRKSNVVKFLN